MNKHRISVLNMRFWRRGKGGFTLIELLVTIAIIGILATLVAAGARHAMTLARRTHCINNIRQWTYSMISYAQDNEDLLPREGHIHDEDAGRVKQDNWAMVYDKKNMDVWYNALPPELSRPRARDYAIGQMGGKKAFYAKDSLNMMQCPEASFPFNVEEASRAYFSLAMNSKLIQPQTLIPAYNTITLSKVAFPEKTAAFMDNIVSDTEPKGAKRFFSNAARELGQASAYATRFSPRHGGTGVISFIDGSVHSFRGPEVVENNDESLIGAAIYPGGKVIWSSDGITNPNRD